MKKNEQIFDLIKSLDKSEKRSFKIYMNRYKAKSKQNSLILFDVIDKLNVYDDKNIKRNLENAPSVLNNFSYEKHRLQQLLLQFLVDFYQTKDDDIELNSILSQVLILSKKNLYQLANRLIEKGLKLSRETCDTFMEYQFLREKLKVSHVLEDPDINEKFTLFENLFKDIGSEHFQHLSYRRIVIECLNAYYKMGSKEELKVKIDNFFKEHPTEPKTMWSKIYYNQARVFYYSLFQEQERGKDFSKKTLQTFESNPEFLKNNIPLYFGVGTSLIKVLAEEGKTSEGFEVLESSKKLLEKFLEKKSSIYSKAVMELKVFYFNLKIYLHLKEYDFETAINLMKQSGNDLQPYFYSHSETRKIEFIFHKILLNFYSNDYSLMLKHLEDFENEVDLNSNPRYLILVKSMAFLNTFEKGNFEELNPIFQSIYYFARNAELLDKPKFKLGLRILRRINNNPEEGDLKAFLIGLIPEIMASETRIFGANFFDLWLESKVNEISLQEISKVRNRIFKGDSSLKEKYILLNR